MAQKRQGILCSSFGFLGVTAFSTFWGSGNTANPVEHKGEERQQFIISIDYDKQDYEFNFLLNQASCESPD